MILPTINKFYLILSYLILLFIRIWCEQNCLVLNTAKSKCTVIYKQQKRALLDNNLSWKEHIEHLFVEQSKLICLLWRKKHLLPYSSHVLFYNSYILPCIDYYLFGEKHLLYIWTKSGDFKNEQLEQFSMFLITLHDLFKQSGWLSIHQRYLYQLCITVHKILNSFDSPLSCLVTNLHKFYNLGSNSSPLLLQVPFPRKEIFKQSFIYSAPIEWNNLPVNIRTFNSFECFKRTCTCKRYLLDT